MLLKHTLKKGWHGKCYGMHILCAWVLSCFSCVLLFETPWAVALQAPLSMGFSCQEYWSRFSFLSPGDLPNPGIEPMSHKSPALAGGFFTTSTTWEVCIFYHSKKVLTFFLKKTKKEKKRLYNTKGGLIYLRSLEKAFLEKEHLFRVEEKTGHSQLG